MGGIEGKLDQRFPQVSVGHRLVLRILPVAPEPTGPPALAEAVDDIGGVAHHLERPSIGTTERADRLECRVDLHPLIGGTGLGPAGVGALGDSPGPTTWSRVPEARTVGVDNQRSRIGHGDMCTRPGRDDGHNTGHG
jgi:hypothetical protein